jgi:UDP-N-acetylmuramate--alanine ligase
VHFVGISGIGMSALARILLQRGERVTGSSDRETALTGRLRAEGAKVTIGHSAANLGDAAQVIVSSAISEENPELMAARAAGLDVLRRGTLLAELMAPKRGIAIAGTHGKTTTTAMTACVLEAGGIDPTVVVGGERVDTGTNARLGASDWFLSESDESDRSFLELRPQIAVLTNVENDHIASDAELPALLAAFAAFLDRVPSEGLVLIGADDRRAAAIGARERAARTLTFGFGAADVVASARRFADFGSLSQISANGSVLGELRLRVPGEINILNALPAIAIGLELGVPFTTAAEALEEFHGVRRRFEILARAPRMTVVEDYAHHPTAVAATIAAARADFAGPIVVAFQPHRFTRTRYLADEFARALRGADRVVLTDVYAASERPLPGVSARSIGEPLRALGGDVHYVTRPEELPDYLLATAPPGALVLMFGAGSITTAAARLGREVRASAAAAGALAG